MQEFQFGIKRKTGPKINYALKIFEKIKNKDIKKIKNVFPKPMVNRMIS